MADRRYKGQINTNLTFKHAERKIYSRDYHLIRRLKRAESFISIRVEISFAPLSKHDYDTTDAFTSPVQMTLTSNPL